VLVSFVILVVSEVTPKVFAIHNAEAWTRLASLPLSLLQVILAPVVWPATRLTETVKRRLRGDEAIHLSGEELRTLVEVGGESGTLEEDEKQLISSIFEFGETTVREVMVPRIDMICLEDTATLDDAVALIREMGHSRIPMYHERVDNIVGIIYAKDLIPYLHSTERSQSLDHLARLPYFVPEGKKIDELLREFQTGRMHLAIVVDEYGGTAGLISLEDILEEIVGEIQDEFDSELPLFRKSGDSSWLMDSRIPVEDANKALGEELLPTDEDYESLGGFVYKLAGEVPGIKSSYEHLDWRFTVMTMKRHRIGLVRVDRLEDGRFDEARGDSL
ncbi:MAG: HlyC/CorC family transporter, partial [Candidatus Cloacimonetes bacterium]|nr:HlyC/CorC family transporter [Candidatus Cloacimonadota bacterium]